MIVQSNFVRLGNIQMDSNYIMIIALHSFHKVDGFEQTPLVLGRNSIDGHDRSHRLDMTWWWDRSHWCVCRWMLEDDPSWKAGVSEPLLKFHPPHPQKLFIDSDLNWIQQTQIWYTVPTNLQYITVVTVQYINLQYYISLLQRCTATLTISRCHPLQRCRC